MRLSKPRGSPILGMNLFPMIDILLLLFFFFVMASRTAPMVNLPASLSQVREPGDAPRLLPTTINIDRDGNYVVAGQRYDLAQVTEWLLRMARDARARGHELRVLIRSDPNAPSAHVNRLIPKLTEIGIREVKFSIQGIGAAPN